MRVGSLVECVVPCLGLTYSFKQVGKYIGKGTILTVREITKTTIKKVPIILFEEIQNPLAPTGHEYGYPPEKFREVLPPTEIDIEAILEKEHV